MGRCKDLTCFKQVSEDNRAYCTKHNCSKDGCLKKVLRNHLCKDHSCSFSVPKYELFEGFDIYGKCKNVSERGVGLCDEHRCTKDGCTDRRYMTYYDSKPYREACKRHMCRGCWERVQKKDRYCRVCECHKSGCETQIQQRGCRYCRHHTCLLAGCTKQRIIDQAVCKDHLCPVRDCENIVWFEYNATRDAVAHCGIYCPKHTCSIPRCPEYASGPDTHQFCSLHDSYKFDKSRCKNKTSRDSKHLFMQYFEKIE